MTTKENKQILLQKTLPFKFRIQSQRYDYKTKKTVGVCVAYIDSRHITQILDDVFGYDGWTEEFYSVNESTYCKIGIWSELSKNFVFKSDAGETKRDYLKDGLHDLISDPEKYLKLISKSPKKEGKGREDLTDIQVYENKIKTVLNDLENSSKTEATDSFKRACVKIGVGRFLYSMGKCEVFIKDWDIVDEKNNKICGKNDTESLSAYCNEICNIPKELVKEINEAKNHDELNEIYYRMSNLRKNQTFLDYLSKQKEKTNAPKNEPKKI